MFMGCSRKVRQTINAAVQSLMQATYKHLANKLRSQLGDEVFMTMWAKGRTLTLDQALVEGEDWK